MKALRELGEYREKHFHEFIQKLRTKLQTPSTAFLFGSRARSEGSYLSDYDVLIITRISYEEFNFRAWALDYGIDLFMIDSDLNTEGYQGGKVVEGIADGQRVGFAVYVKNVDALRLINVDFTWDGTKAEKASETGYTISIDDSHSIFFCFIKFPRP